MPRKRKLNPAIQLEICKSIAAGIDVESACVREGVSKSTYYDWLKRGEAGESPFDEFLEAIDQAMAEVTRRVTYHVVKAAESDWKAGAWWLERRRGSVYGPPKQRLEQSGPDGGPIKTESAVKFYVPVNPRIPTETE